MKRVLFVCMGNICRSPTAEAVFRRKAQEAGIGGQVEIDSAGTHGYHEGQPPDERAQEAGKGRGYDLSQLRARLIVPGDLDRFDLVLGMDRNNLGEIRRLMRNDGTAQRAQVRLLSEYCSEASGNRGKEVPDPYYEEGGAFDTVLDMVEDAADGLVRELGRGN